MNDLPTLSPTKFHILELMLEAGKPMYGLEMVRESGRLKRGTVYVTLSRMTDDGLVESWTEDSEHESGLPRRLYRVTGHGTKVFTALELARSHMLAMVPS